MIEDKIKKYLDRYRIVKLKLPTDTVDRAVSREEAAHDIAEICEKEIEKIVITESMLFANMQKENAELKEQLKAIKYLDRQEVEDILDNLLEGIITESGYRFRKGEYGNAVNAILKLAVDISGLKFDREGHLQFSKLKFNKGELAMNITEIEISKLEDIIKLKKEYLSAVDDRQTQCDNAGYTDSEVAMEDNESRSDISTVSWCDGYCKGIEKAIKIIEGKPNE